MDDHVKIRVAVEDCGGGGGAAADYDAGALVED